jgi:hypothetical protein
MGQVSYQWLSDSIEIPGASNSTYTLAATDVAKKISVRASYTDQQGTKENVNSAPTDKIALPFNHIPTGTVSINGQMQQNQTLTATNNIADVDGIATPITYRWLD